MKRQRLYVNLVVFCLICSMIGVALAGCDKNHLPTKPTDPTQSNESVPTNRPNESGELPGIDETGELPGPDESGDPVTPDGKNVPVYQGMSITKENASLQAGSESPRVMTLSGWSALPRANAVPLKNDENTSGTNGNNGNNGNHYGRPDKYFERETNAPYEGDIEEIVTIEIPGDEVTKYYVTPGETFTVEVHLSNPDQFEIQSFTLNGVKYANYMFKENSTLELLRLDVVAPDAPGYFELTIDAIKYIDGTEIKDVRMDGDKTVKAGVTYPELPHVEFVDVAVGATSVTLTVELFDPYNALKQPARFCLSDGTKIVSEQELTVGQNTVTVQGLLAGTGYECGVVAAYDPVDGTGVQVYWLGSQTLETQEGVAVSDVTIGQDRLDFVLEFVDKSAALTSVVVMDDASGDTVLTLSDTALRTVEGLLSAHAYRVVLSYEYTLDGQTLPGEITIHVTTLEKQVPTLTIEQVVTSQSSVSFDLLGKDEDGILAIDKIELLSGDEVVATATGDAVSVFDNLLSNHDYRLRVTYSYDLGDGAGAHVEVIEASVKTLAKSSPVIRLTGADITKTSVSFTAQTEDIDRLLSIGALELWDGDTLIATAESLDALFFENLLTDHDYTLKVTYSYDLADGAGMHTETATCVARTLARPVPTVRVENPVSAQTGLSFDITTTDPDALMTIVQVELLIDGAVVANVPYDRQVSFSGLTAGTLYTARVTFTYDLGDGAGVQTKIAERQYPTLAASISVEDVVLMNENVVKKGEEINLNIFFKNSSQIELLNIYVNGQKVEVVGGNRIDRAIVKFVPDDTGLLEFSVDRVEYLYYGETITQRVDSDISVTYPVYSDLAVEFLPVSLSPYEYTGTGIYLSFDNSDGYVVYAINGSTSFTKLSDHEFFVVTDRIDSIEYGYDNYGKTQQTTNYYKGTEVWCDRVVEIYTVEEFLAMQNGYYILMNDLDLSRLKADYTIQLSGVLDGNGHTITGLSGIVDTGTKDYNPIIIGGSIYDTTFKDVFFNVTHTREDYWISVSPFGWARLINCDVTGDITVTGTQMDVMDMAYHNHRESTGYDVRVTVNGTLTKQTFAPTARLEKGAHATLESGYVYYRFPNGAAIFLQGIGATQILVPAFDQIYADASGMTYLLSGNGTAMLIGVDAALTEVIIPKTVNGCVVTAIAEGLFSWKSELTSVTILADITTIPVNMFAGCQNLTAVVLPDTVTAIENSAFLDCHKLSSIKLPASLVTIGDNAFSNCWKLPFIEIPASVTTIGNGAFSSCSAMEYVTFAEGSRLTIIGESAFNWCNSLKSVTFAKDGQLTELGAHAFAGCHQLTEIFLPASLKTIRAYAFDNCGALNIIYIPASVTTIEERAFQYCWNIRSINLGAAEQPAGWSSLWNLRQETEDIQYNLVWGVTGFCTDAQGLTYRLMNNGTAHVIAFDQTATDVVIPETVEGYTVTSIGERAFAYAHGLTTIVLPSKLESIGTYAFVECNALQALLIPASVTTIEEKAFMWCWGISSIQVGATEKPAGWAHRWNTRGDGEGDDHTVAWNAAGTYTDEQGLTYLLRNDGTAIITGYAGTATELTIPKTVEGYAIVAIQSGVFNYNATLLSVEILAELTELPDEIFRECWNLATVKLPDTLTSIGNNAFHYCRALTSIKLPASVTTIGSYAFYDCDALTSINLPASLIAIESYAFYSCDALTDIVLPSKLERIGTYAFFNCMNLRSMLIPASVTTIEEKAFLYCWNLTSIQVGVAEKPDGWADRWNARGDGEGEDHTVVWNSAGNYTDEQGLTYLFLNDGTAIVTGYTGTATDLTIPKTVEGYAVVAVQSGLFTYNTTLVSVEILAEITELPEQMFEGCHSLTTVKLPDTLTSIGNNAFYYCWALTSIKLPASVTTIGSYAFYDCDVLTSIDLPVSLIAIESYAFNNCDGLTDIALPSKLERIGAYAFANCSALQRVSIPATVTTIEEKAFIYCGNLTSIQVGVAEKPDGWADRWDVRNDFEDEDHTVVWNVAGTYTDDQGLIYLFRNDGTAIITGYTGTATALTIPKTVEGYAVVAVRNELFTYNTTLVSVEILAEITELSERIFEGCSELTSVKLPETLTSIGNNAFSGCNALNSINLPAAVTSIGSYAFQGCERLTSAELPAALITLGERAFAGCVRLSSVAIPATLETIGNGAFSGCSRLETVTFAENGVLTTIGDAAFSNCSKLRSVEIPASVTTIGREAFASSGLETVTFAAESNLTTLGAYAFAWCNSLPSVTLDMCTKLVEIGEFTFAECYQMSALTLPASLQTIRTYAFNNCFNLKSLYIPASVTVIEELALQYCSNLTVYTGATEKPAGWSKEWNLRSLDEDYEIPVVWNVAGTYTDAQGLSYLFLNDGAAVVIGYTGTATAVSIPDAINGHPVTGIGERAFANCYALTVIVLPSNLESIATHAFIDCNGLQSISIPASVTTIGEKAFLSCWALSSIQAAATEKPAGWADRWNARSEGDGDDHPVTWNATAIYTDAQGLSYIFRNDGTAMITGYNGTATELAIPKTVEGYAVTAIRSGLFYGNSTLLSVEILAELTELPNEIFRECWNLATVKLPDTITTIGDYAFQSCTALTTLNLPAALTTIGNSAISSCSALTAVTIPASVTVIGDHAFANDNVLATVTFAEGSMLTALGERAFASCSQIETFAIPSSVTTIGAQAFEWCTSLKSVTFAEGSALTTIGNNAFYDCWAMTSIDLPASVTTIGSYAFYNCNGLTDIVLPSKLERIGAYAFANCSALQSVSIPATVTTIEEKAFIYCWNITSIQVGVAEKPAGWADRWNACSDSIGDDYTVVWNAAGTYTDELGLSYLFSNDGTATVIGYSGTATELTIPDTVNGYTVTSIESRALYNCMTLTSIRLPASLTTIGERAFAYCEKLTTVTIPASVVTLGVAAFESCYDLELVTIDEGCALTVIPEYLFANCSRLHAVQIPATVTAIGSYAFQSCSRLETLTIGEGSALTTIGERAFASCEKLISVAIPDTVTTIGAGAFDYCTRLETVTFGENSQLTAIADSMFSNCSRLVSIQLPASVTTIGSNAFYWNYTLYSVTLADGSRLTTIGEYAFNGCSNLQSVSGLEGSQLTEIGCYAFNGCSALRSISLPTTLTTIREYALSSTGLLSVLIPASVTTIEEYAFLNSGWDLVIYAASAARPSGWSIDWNIRESYNDTEYPVIWDVVGFHTDAQGLKYLLLNNGTATLIASTSTVTDLVIPKTVEGYAVTALLEIHAGGLFSARTDLVSVEILAEVSSIPHNMFTGCTNLTTVKLPDTVTSIGSTAFSNCEALTTVTLPASLVTLGYGAFQGCTALESIAIPASVTTIENYAFQGCKRLETVTFGEGSVLTTIGERAFQECTRLVSMTIPASVTTIGLYAFENCNHLEAVTFEANSALTDIADGAFSNCSKLKAIEIPASLKTIGMYAFQSNGALQSVTLAEGSQLTAIGDYAFAWCFALKSVTFATDGKLTSIGNYAFAHDYELKEIVFPNTLESIGNYAFEGCSALIAPYIPASVKSMGENVFHYCGDISTIYVEAAERPSGWSRDWHYRDWNNDIEHPVLWNAKGFCTDDQGLTYLLRNDGTAAVIDYNGTVAALTIPKTIEEHTVTDILEKISGTIFRSGNDTLMSVEILAEITRLPAHAFDGCWNLQTITLPSTLESIGTLAFAGCMNLTTIYIPASVTVIEDHVFHSCWALSTIQVATAEQPAGWTTNWNQRNPYSSDNEIPVTWNAVAP